MATDATGTPTTPDNIPTFTVGTDSPSGLGGNAQMAAIQTALSARVSKPATPATGDALVWNGTTWARAAGTPSSGVFLRGDGAWATAGVTTDGWTAVAATLTFSTADAPTYVVTTGVDLTASIPVGARIKLTHAAAVKYFIVTAIGATTITLYGGTDYTLAATAITLPFYSREKAPVGFPLSPLKWTQEFRDAVGITQSSPVTNTWYNLASQFLDVPIGSWRLYHSTVIQGYHNAALEIECQATLSTGAASASDADFTASVYGGADATAGVVQGAFHREKLLLLAAKTRYYHNIRTTRATQLQITTAVHPLIIRAVCAYL